MHVAKNGSCLCCGGVYLPDHRNAGRQKYCTKPDCKQASKAASQHLWLSKPENLDYHRGDAAVLRVQAWQAAHPEYRERQKARRSHALQDICAPEITGLPQESSPVDVPRGAPAGPALQDFVMTQPLVFIGLIAHLFGFSLQDDMVRVIQILQQSGADIANGRRPDELFKTANFPGAHAPRAGPVQLDRSAPGAR